MIKRGWIEQSDTTMLKLSWFVLYVNSPKENSLFPHAAKRSSYEERNIPSIQLAWLFRVRQIAQSISVPKYSEKALRQAVQAICLINDVTDEVRHIPAIMLECGVRFV